MRNFIVYWTNLLVSEAVLKSMSKEENKAKK